MASQADPGVTGAIVKGAVVEAVLLAVGGAVFLATGEIAWVIGAALVGAVIIVLLLTQAGAFKAPHERR